MRAVVQRVKHCTVTVASETVAEIEAGLLAYVGFESGDRAEDIRYLADKIVNLRIFQDDAGKMNLSMRDLGRELLVVSQFTLQADVRKGRRPSYDRAEKPEIAEGLYEEFLAELRRLGSPPAHGRFGARMEVSYTNTGPVTILLDSKKLF